MNIKTNIKHLELALPIYNASGAWCTTEKELHDIAKSKSAAVMFKSMTVKPREGNPEPRLRITDSFSINSMGLPNRGVDYYCKIVDMFAQYQKPLFASIAGFAENEFYDLFERVNDKSFDAIEVNLSCPNVSGKSVFAYNPKISVRILKRLRKRTNKILGVKLPPFNEREEIRNMAEGFVSIGVDFATLINSYPLGCAIDIKKEIMTIKPNMGIGGLGGPSLKAISLAQVVLFHHFSDGKLAIIGVGGVNKGSDIYEYILAGASAVGVGTALIHEGPKIFKRLENELVHMLKEKRVENIKEKIGKLKFME